MSEVLKAFEEELQSKNFKGYWQNQQGMSIASRCRHLKPVFGKARIFSLRWRRPEMWSGSMCLFAASFSSGTPRSKTALRALWC